MSFILGDQMSKTFFIFASWSHSSPVIPSPPPPSFSPMKSKMNSLRFLLLPSLSITLNAVGKGVKDDLELGRRRCKKDVGRGFRIGEEL